VTPTVFLAVVDGSATGCDTGSKPREPARSDRRRRSLAASSHIEQFRELLVNQPNESHRPSRRDFLTALAGALPGGALLESTAPRVLSLVHTHTNERLRLEYFHGGQYLPDALSSLNQFLRDFRTGEVYPIEPGLFDLMHRLAGAAGCDAPFHVISGYRSPKTNAALRQRSEGVAAGSLHMKGQAIDIRPIDVPLAKLRASALALRAGGVGYYPSSNFIHVDVGRVRTW
jgi:uncharacterized protein YcbK (DUF882 family)